MKVTRVRLILGAATCCLTFGIASAAEPTDRRRGPPPAAFEACNGKASGDTCTVSFGDRTINGTCKPSPRDDRLFCVPDHAPHRPPPDRSNP